MTAVLISVFFRPTPKTTGLSDFTILTGEDLELSGPSRLHRP